MHRKNVLTIEVVEYVKDLFFYEMFSPKKKFYVNQIQNLIQLYIYEDILPVFVSKTSDCEFIYLREKKEIELTCNGNLGSRVFFNK